MSNEMKKRAVIEMVKQRYNRASRFYGGTPKHDLTISVYLGEFPGDLKLTLSELTSILFGIEKKYKGTIRIRPLNNNSKRIKRNYYPIVVKPGTFSSEANSSKKPTITLHGGYWCVALPGQDKLIPTGRVGSFNGELFAILGVRWGEFQSVENVFEELKTRVTDMRTKGQGYRSPETIKEHLKEINRSLGKGGSRRLKRIGSWSKTANKTVGIVWENILWEAVLRISRGVPTVGFARMVKPTRTRKKASK